jgi:hypothetical protein
LRWNRPDPKPKQGTRSYKRHRVLVRAVTKNIPMMSERLLKSKQTSIPISR